MSSWPSGYTIRPAQRNTHGPYTRFKALRGEVRPRETRSTALAGTNPNVRPDQASVQMGGSTHPDRARARALYPGHPGAGAPDHADRSVRVAAREPLAAEEVRRAEAA